MDGKTKPKVILVDDHPVVRQGLASLVEAEGFDVVAAVATAAQALDALAAVPADLVVVDLTLEKGAGMDVLAAMKKVVPAGLAVVYSVHEDGDLVRRAIEAGARGYVTKREDPDILLEALRRVHQGERFLSPVASRAVAEALAQSPGPMPEEVLSQQEYQVYALIGEGHSAQETADRMGLSTRTVDTYLTRILGKLNLPGRRELRLHATRHARQPGAGGR